MRPVPFTGRTSEDSRMTIKKTIKILRENDIGSVGTVLIGLKEDTESKIKERLRVADEIAFRLLHLTDESFCTC